MYTRIPFFLPAMQVVKLSRLPASVRDTINHISIRQVITILHHMVSDAKSSAAPVPRPPALLL